MIQYFNTCIDCRKLFTADQKDTHLCLTCRESLQPGQSTGPTDFEEWLQAQEINERK